MFRFSRIFLRLLGIGLLLTYFLACIAILGARYWVLPHIDNWRPQIVQHLSSRFGVDIRAGHIVADWKGLNPRITLTDASLSPRGSAASPPSEAGQAAQGGLLHIPTLSARLSWRSLFSSGPVFLNLQASGIQVDLRRDTQGRLHALGQVFDPDAPRSADNPLGKFLDWLAPQKRIVLDNASIRWRDDMRGAAPLRLDHLALTYANDGQARSFSFSVTPPPALGESVSAVATIAGFDGNGGAALERGTPWPDMDAKLYVRLDKLRPGAWSPWLDLPATLTVGQVSGQARLEMDKGRLGTLTTDLQLQDGNWHPGHGVQLAAGTLHAYLSGPTDDYLRLLDGGLVGEKAAATQSGLSYRLLTSELQVSANYVFSHPLELGKVVASGTARRQSGVGLRIDVDQAFIANGNGQASAQGSWRQGGSSAAGLIDVTGHIDRARLASIAAYLPERVNAHASSWLEHGLVAGEVQDAQLLLRGDLIHFPFQDSPDTGDFRIEGPYKDAIIDYLPSREGKQGWPRLEAMQGTATLHRADLSLTVSQAVTLPVPGQPIQLRQVQARIANLEHSPVLTVKGDTSAPADSYLALMTHSPLGEMLGHVFDQASASGQWEVPLALTIPLTHAKDSEVEGAIHFAGNTVKLSPQMPVLSGTEGELAFSHESASSKALKGTFLGGPMTISGELGGPDKTLRLQGQLSAAALTQYAGVQGLKRLSGHISYTAALQRDQARHLALTLTSDLKGLAADLPKPLGKSATTALPLKAIWKSGAPADSRSLAVEVGSTVHALLLHRDRKSGGEPYFYAGALGVNKAARPPASGLSLDVRYPSVALDTWRQIGQELSSPLQARPDTKKASEAGSSGQGSAGQSGGLLPSLTQLRVQADTATFGRLAFDQATLTAQQPEPGQWRMDVSSTQTAGTVRWNESDGRIRGAVDARFDRLDLGATPPAVDAGSTAQGGQTARSGTGNPVAVKPGSPNTAPAKTDVQTVVHTKDDDELISEQLSGLPALKLRVKRLRLFGRHVGGLSVRGASGENGKAWQVEQFHLTSPHGTMNGSGQWRLSGPERGLTLKAHADIKNLGAYMDEAGFRDIVIDGSGTMDAQVSWRNLPWAFSPNDIDGTLRFDLSKGRFSNLNSHTARLLELLSLQSVKRLARLDFDPASLVRDGFPFDTLRGSVVARQGILSTDDYRIVGPAGTIVLEGSTKLADQSMDMQAAVVPNLDVSGAAIAAGIAINPIVGVGAFLAQWLLQAPLSQAMASQYHITGDWSNPEITDVSKPPASNKPDAAKEPTP